MGTSLSTNIQNIQNEIITTATNECTTPGNSVNALYIHDVYFKTPPDCKDSDKTITQAAVVNSDCIINSLQYNAALAATKLSAPAQTGLGLSISTDYNVLETDISNTVTNKCSSAPEGSATGSGNVIYADNVVIDSCNFSLVQNATYQQTCEINETQDMIADIASDLAAETSGFFDGTFGKVILWIIIGIFVLVVLLVFGFVILKMMKSKDTQSSDQNQEDDGDNDDSEQTGGVSRSNSQKNSQTIKNGSNGSCIILFTILLVILLILIAGISRQPSDVETTSNLLNFSNNLDQAQKIAGLYNKDDATDIIIPKPQLNDIIKEKLDNYYQLQYESQENYDPVYILNNEYANYKLIN